MGALRSPSRTLKLISPIWKFMPLGDNDSAGDVLLLWLVGFSIELAIAALLARLAGAMSNWGAGGYGPWFAGMLFVGKRPTLQGVVEWLTPVKGCNSA